MAKETIHLSDHFTYRKILRFSLSSILMMVLTSLYWIVDGFFLSNFVSTSAFAGVNLIFPVIMIVSAVGFMFGTGGAALVSKRLGEQNRELANKTFSLITYTTFAIGIVFSIIFFFLVRPIAEAFASINAVETSEEMIDSATLYGRIMIAGVSLFALQGYFHTFFSVNEKAFHGFLFTLFAGITNMLLDWLLVGTLGLGVVGAASASLTGFLVGSVGPYIYFRFGRNNLIKLGKTSINLKDIGQSALNGISELVSDISGSIVTIVFNIQLLKYLGESGVIAYGVIGYVCFVFFAVFIGYCIGVSPIIGYNYGAKNYEELSNVTNKSLFICFLTGLAMSGIVIGLSGPLSLIFVNSDDTLFELSKRAMMIYSVCYMFSGICMFGSSFFTALNNGLVSAFISIVRTLVFQISLVFILPLFMGSDGIWASIGIAEILSLALTVTLILAHQKKYGYRLTKVKSH